jgi:hypothetical protein
MSKEKLILEPSTNSHVLEGDVINKKNLNELGGVVLKINGNGLVLHGEHGIIVTEETDVIKLTQQEFNPVTKLLQNSFD